jgi:dephospho-CoA kinase
VTVLEFSALARRILERTSRHPVRLIAVDGGAGAGKSTFAATLGPALGDVPIIPMDDFAAFDDLVEYWPRFEAEVIAPG